MTNHHEPGNAEAEQDTPRRQDGYGFEQSDTLMLALDALASIRDVAAEATLDDLGLRLSLVEQIGEQVDQLTADLETTLIEAMPTDRHYTPNVGLFVREARPPKTTWDKDRVRSDVIVAITRRIATDRITGEIRQVEKLAVADALDWVQRTWTLGAPLTGKNAGIRDLGLDVTNYRTFDPQGSKITYHPGGVL